MGAVAALKGYRTQFLYSLHRVLADFDKGYNFHIEGIFEDLDITDENGNYIEAIQIKNHSVKIAFSDLFSRNTSFFKRAEKMVSKNEEAKIKLISFGHVSDELNNMQTLSKKLIDKGFNKDKVNKILQNFSVEIVNEDTLTSEIINKLKQLSLFSDSTVALELLIYWIYQLAEANTTIQAKQLITNLERIGRFINQQKSFNDTFFNTIIPLSQKTLDSENIEIHQQNFYYGVSAKYEHILADLDVIREDKLNKINDALKNNSVVFIHGASGQGKSALAYRYLKDFVSNTTSYELKISQSLEEVNKIINSIEVLSKGLNFPVTIYIDVPPQNLNWNNIVIELNGKKNLKFLITIRQEDWNKTSDLQQFYNFEDIELTFDKSEAKFIYDNLSKVKKDLQFTDFDESWEVFGNKGLLLEYIYLINQGNTLKSRLSDQIHNLRNLVSKNNTEELEILRFVALSDSFNSKISYKKLIKHLDIKEPLKYIRDLQKEYLIQYSEDGEYLIGLHPIRSKIITEILFDEDVYLDIFEYIDTSLQLINEEDLLNYLLFSFSKDYDPTNCLKNLKVISFKSWLGYLNVFNALLWKGIYDFMMKSNKDTFIEAYELYGKSWYLLLNFVLTKDKLLDDEDFLFKNKNEEFLNKNKELRSRITNKEDIYNYCIVWLKSINDINILPKGELEWKSLGEYLFWVNHLKLNISIKIDDEVFTSFFTKSFDSVLEQATVLMGLKAINYERNLIENLEDYFIKNVRKKFNVICFNINNEEIDTIYIYNFFNKNQAKSLNSLSVNLLDLMRKGFPDINMYKTKCYGHNITGVNVDYDDSLKNIPQENFHLDFFIQMNVLFNNIFSYSKRPGSWKEYIEIIQKNRKLNVSSLKKFKIGLIKYFKNNTEGFNYFVENVTEIEKEIISIKECELPKIVSDRWGYFGDNKNMGNLENKPSISTEKYNNFNKFKQGYFSPVSTFINVTGFKEISNTFHRLYGNIEKIENFNNRNVTEINLYEAVINLFRFHREFEKLFSKYVDEAEEKKLRDEEIGTLISLFTVWKTFLHSNHRTLKATKLSNLTLEKTKLDFQLGLLKSSKIAFKGSNCLSKIERDEVNRIFYFYLNVDFENYTEAMSKCLLLIIDAFGSVHHTSLKKMLIDLNFEKIVIVPLFSGNPINRNFMIIETSRVSMIKDKLDNDETYNLEGLVSAPQDDDIKIFDNLGLLYWNKIVPEISTFEILVSQLEHLKYYLFHVRDICINIPTLDNLGQTIFETYISELSSHIYSEIIEPVNLSLNQLNDYIQIKDNIELNNIIRDYVFCLQRLNNGFVNNKKYVLSEDFVNDVTYIPSTTNLNRFYRNLMKE